MIEIVMPCIVKHGNAVELVTLGMFDLSWSPSWSNLFGTTNKVIIYDIISDNSLEDDKILINVGHTSIKLNDLKFLFKLNGIHSNTKLYYDNAVISKLINHSIPANMLMTMIDYCEENNLTGLFSARQDGLFDISCIINDLLHKEINSVKLLKFFKKFLDLSIRDGLEYEITYDNDNPGSAEQAHIFYNATLSKKNNEVKKASEALCSKLINLLQLDRRGYEQVKDKPIPAGNMSYNPIRPNFTRSTCFELKGQTEETQVEDFTSGVIYYKCSLPITSSFILYSDNGNITISDATVAFRPEPYKTKDPNLFSELDSSIRQDMKAKKLFTEIPLNMDLINKALKAFVAGDLIYFYAITGILFTVKGYVVGGSLVMHDLTDELSRIISGYEPLALALGGVRSDNEDLIIS